MVNISYILGRLLCFVRYKQPYEFRTASQLKRPFSSPNITVQQRQQQQIPIPSVSAAKQIIQKQRSYTYNILRNLWFLLLFIIIYVLGMFRIGFITVIFSYIVLVWVDIKKISKQELQLRTAYSVVLTNNDALKTMTKDMNIELPPWLLHSDIERVAWLNQVLGIMWPSLNKAIVDYIRSYVQPILMGYRPSFLDELRFGELNLGSVPPIINGVQIQKPLKAHRQSRVIIDLHLRFYGDPTIVVQAKTSAVEMNIELTDIDFSCLLRVELGPLEDVFPCFSALSISFVGKPRFDFDLQAAKINIMMIPGLRDYLVNLLKVSAFGAYTWPKRLVIPIMSLEAIEMVKLMRAHPKGVLHVRVCQAKELKSSRWGHKKDPFCEVILSGVEKKTKIIENSLKPVWLESFEFNVMDPESETLTLNVWDHHALRANSLLGTTSIHISSLQATPNESKSMWKLLTHERDAKVKSPDKVPYRGQIQVVLEWKPFDESTITQALMNEMRRVHNEANIATPPPPPTTTTTSTKISKSKSGVSIRSQESLESSVIIDGESGILVVRVIEAVDLAKADEWSESDPYCRVEVNNTVRKTKIIDDDNSPHWHEEFEFLIDDLPHVSSCVSVKVYDYDCVGSDTFLGAAIIDNIRLKDILDGHKKNEGKHSNNNEVAMNGYDVHDVWLDLDGVRGQVQSRIHLELIWKPFESSPTATNLSSTSSTLMSTPLQQPTTLPQLASTPASMYSSPSYNDETPEPQMMEKKSLSFEQLRMDLPPLPSKRSKSSANLSESVTNTIIGNDFQRKHVNVDALKAKLQRVGGRLEVFVECANDLEAKDNNHTTSDPFVRLRIHKQKKKTKVIKHSLDPIWNEAFSFNVVDAASDTLLVRVDDYDRFTKNEKLGNFEISIVHIIMESMKNNVKYNIQDVIDNIYIANPYSIRKRWKLLGVTKGTVTMTLTFNIKESSSSSSSIVATASS